MTTAHSHNTIVIEPYGGAINAYPVNDSAFIHRDVLFDFFVDVFWVQDSDKPQAVDWLDNFMTLMQPWFNGHVYQNYPRRTLTDYRWMYWGDAFNSLLYVKKLYDPHDFFTFQQSIRAYTPSDGPGVRRDTSTPRFSGPQIVRSPHWRPTRRELTPRPRP